MLNRLTPCAAAAWWSFFQVVLEKSNVETLASYL